MDRVAITYQDHIAHVELTRSDKMNAVDQAMIDAIIAAGEEVASSGARACVISGQGKGFCAGIDITGLSSFFGQDPHELMMPRTHGDGTTNQWQEVSLVWTRTPMPVIAAIHGVCFGAGMQLALGADIRIASPDAKLAVMEMKWGIVPDMGGMVLMPRLLASDVMRRLTYTAAPISGEEALRVGLITELSEEPKTAAMALASEIASKSPSAIRAAKQLMGVAETAAAKEVLHAESEAQAGLFGGADQMEVIAATMQKRSPVFK